MDNATLSCCQLGEPTVSGALYLQNVTNPNWAFGLVTRCSLSLNNAPNLRAQFGFGTDCMITGRVGTGHRPRIQHQVAVVAVFHASGTDLARRGHEDAPTSGDLGDRHLDLGSGAAASGAQATGTAPSVAYSG